MKKFLVCVLLALATSVAFAYVPPEFPPLDSEADIPLEWDGQAWVAQVDPLQGALLFRMGETWSYFCNGQWTDGQVACVDVMPVELEASVAQYLEAVLSRTQMTYYIYKPHKIVEREEIGRDWAVDSISLMLKSNGAILVSSDPIEDMIGTKGVIIPTWWAITQTAAPPPIGDPAWIGAGGIYELLIEEQMTHPEMYYKLWNRIRTEKCTSACEYGTWLRLRVCLLEQKPWVIQDLPMGPII